ncbi:archease [Candidatus Woesearchaeota archaeon]|nr:archease [Candidatus Woesearchaeota archaeon]
MRKKFVFVEGVATADAVFDAFGKDVNELFSNAALALTAIMIDPVSLRAVKRKKIVLEEKDVPSLLFRFLEELIFLKDTVLFLPKTCKVNVVEKKKVKLVAECVGATIDYKRHKLGVDAKAVTYHKFDVMQEKSGWKARVVIDI